MYPELGMGIGTGMGFDMEAFSSPSSSTATTTVTANAAASNAHLYGGGLPPTEMLRIDDLLDFSTPDGFFDPDHNNTNQVNINNSHLQHHVLPQPEAPFMGSVTANCSYLSENNNNSAASTQLAAFPDDLFMPSEEAAELEWLSKFVEDSFSDMPFPNCGTMGNFSNVSPATADVNSNSSYSTTNNNSAVLCRARSKRSRAPATATHLATATSWSSLPPPQLCTSPSSSSSSSDSKHRAGNGGKKKDVMTPLMMCSGAGAAAVMEGGSGGARKCTHCSSEKTPQWRTGPLGPKTLCNACGVRYKSGRLVPEYRPASSPTFVLTQHSNSHRKVLELRRQKELLLRHHHQHQQRHELSPANANTTASTTRPDLLLRDYEVC